MSDLGKLILRLNIGILMLFHGLHKLGDGKLDGIMGKLVEVNLPESLAFGVYAGEILAPLMLIFGVFTRLGALMIVVNMLFAIGLMHMADLNAFTPYGGWKLELQAFYLFGALAVTFLGAGRIALTRN
jgi:putative oxidoreductase